MELVQKQNLIKWLDEQVAAGKEVKLCWEGGGDSGWVYFEVDDDTVENEHTNKLVDMMYDHLDYGSWAGEFSAAGSATYNAETKCFEGIDHYTEDDSTEYPCSIKLEVPADVWFDELVYQIEEQRVVDVELHVKNGFRTERHEEVAELIKESLDDQVDNLVEKFCNDPEQPEFRDVWESGTITRSEFVQKGDKLVHTITSMRISTSIGDDKDVCLDLNFLLDLENDTDDEK